MSTDVVAYASPDGTVVRPDVGRVFVGKNLAVPYYRRNPLSVGLYRYLGYGLGLVRRYD